MKAIILAAGEGKRLRPLTKNTPKCMIKFFEKSLLELQIDTFRFCNITDISVVTGYCGNMINFPNITYFRNLLYETTNMVETLFCAKEKLTESVIISYGDIIFEKQILQKLIDSKDDCSVIIDKKWEEYWKIRFDDPLKDAETLALDSNNFVVGIGQKPKNIDEINGQYIGLLKFQNRGLEELKKFYEKSKARASSEKNPLNPNIPFEKSYMTDLLQAFINEGHKIKAIPVENGWLEFDTVNDYDLYKKMFIDKTLKKFISTDIFSK